MKVAMNPDIKIYDKRPADFAPKVEVAATYVNLNGKILLLQIADPKKEIGFWGVPAGKLEALEKPLHAAQRELFEETGIHVESTDLLLYLGALYIRKPELDYVYHRFEFRLTTMPVISLSAEHSAYRWISKEEAETLPLMKGGKTALDTYYQLIEKRV